MWFRRRRRDEDEEAPIDLAERLAPYIRDPRPVTVIDMRDEGDRATSAPAVPDVDTPAGADRQIAGAGERRSSSRPS